MVSNRVMMQARSLYLHFPFCETKCHYCDFYSLAAARTRPDDPDRFTGALRREIEIQGSQLAPELDTIFMGGGTPSMTPPEVMGATLEPLWRHTSVRPGTEWTMEANPSSVDRARFEGYRALGINRVSMGIQAVRDDLLKALGRVHDRKAAFRALESVFEAGFTNVSVDLLCGVPAQSLEDLDEAISVFTSFPITHLSCYLLTLPPHHRMHKDLPDEETQLAHLLHIDRRMREKGFEHYEISNFARPGHRAGHNLRYWQGRSYLGLGPSAHSFDEDTSRRWKNISSLHRYAALLEDGTAPVEWTETLTPEQRELERWMLALRLADGFPAEWLDTPRRLARAEELARHGYLEAHPETPNHHRLTARGFAVSDQIIQSLA